MFLQQVTLSTEPNNLGSSSEYTAGSFKYSDALSDLLINSDRAFVPFYLSNIIASIQLNTAYTSQYTSTISIEDTIKIKDLAQKVFYSTPVVDRIAISDNTQYIVSRLNNIIDTLKLRDEVQTSGNFISTLASALALQDIALSIFHDDALDTLLFFATLNTKVEYYTALIDQLRLFDLPSSVSLGVYLEDSILFNESSVGIAVIRSLIADNINFFGGMSLDGDQFLVYTLNTDSLGITEYDNYNFNSFSFPYAANSNGIYKLEGNDDNGTPILASIKTGVIDFGSSLLKQVPTAYLGIADNGRVLLKTISTNNGVKKERWYEVTAHNSAYDTTRVKLGRGVKSKYWQFELSNIDGENIDLNSLDVIPIQLQRRV